MGSEQSKEETIDAMARVGQAITGLPIPVPLQTEAVAVHSVIGSSCVKAIMGSAQSKEETIDAMARVGQAITGLPIPVPLQTEAVAVHSVIGSSCTPHPFDPSAILWSEVKTLLQSLRSLFSSSSSSNAKNHFILVLLFTAWREYITKVCQYHLIYFIYMMIS